MHEMAIAMDLLECVLDEAGRHEVVRVEEVEVTIGVMRSVVPEALEMAFEAAAAGSVAEGARLKIAETQPVARCLACGASFGASVDEFVCPRCGRAETEIVEGNEIMLTSIACITEAEGASA